MDDTPILWTQVNDLWSHLPDPHISFRLRQILDQIASTDPSQQGEVDRYYGRLAAIDDGAGNRAIDVGRVEATPAPPQGDNDIERFRIPPKALEGYTWERLGGLEAIRQELFEAVAVPLLRPDVAASLGLRVGGTILEGPPGTGKTSAVRALANDLGDVDLFVVRGAELESKWRGESQRFLTKLLSPAPGSKDRVVVFDEGETVFPVRDDDEASNRLSGTGLALMDGLDPGDRVAVILTTNRVDHLDPAFRRPGRFDRVVHVPLPDHAGRRAIWKIQGEHYPLHHSVDLDEWARLTEGLSGAHIAGVCSIAATLALRELGVSDRASLRDVDAASVRLHHRHLVGAHQRVVEGAAHE